MNVQENKELLLKALTQSFVDDYTAYKKIVENINCDFNKLEIDYQWTYDEFCVNFLNESMKKLEQIDIFKELSFDQFYKNFWKFNLIVVRTIIISKFDELGYNFEEYDSLSNDIILLNNSQLN